MFTGIIQAISEIEKAEKIRNNLFLTIRKPNTWKIKRGDSIAVDGVCLTVKKTGQKTYLTELMPETLNKTTFGQKVPARVNLESSLKFSDLLGGHLVSGHVDAIGRIESIISRGHSRVYEFSFPKQFSRLLADKGSVAVDGVSLTVVKITKSRFTVSLVSYTIEHTVLGTKRKGDIVNLEFDMMAKYVDRLQNRKRK